MSKKKINIIGASLYSLFLAYHLSKNKSYQITVYEKSNKLLPSFNHINIKGIKVNPGFHSFEKKRSKSLLNFLKKFGIKFLQKKKGRGLLINKFLVDETIDINKWPQEIFKSYNLKKNDVNFDLSEIQKKNEKKYCSYLIKNLGEKLNFNNSLQLVYPWFFPKNYSLNSNDEGSKNLNLVRKGKIINSYCFPKGYLFESISSKILIKLKKNKIKFEFNSDIKFDVSKYSKVLLNQKEIQGFNIICLPFFSIIANLINYKIKIPKFKSHKLYTAIIKTKNNNKLNRFTEIISSSHKMKYLRRISRINNYGSEKNFYYQIEFLMDKKINDINKQLENYIYSLEKILTTTKLEKNIKFDAKCVEFVRFIYSPNENIINNLILKFEKIFKMDNKIFLPRYITWPINTNKQYYNALEDEKIIKKLI